MTLTPALLLRALSAVLVLIGLVELGFAGYLLHSYRVTPDDDGLGGLALFGAGFFAVLGGGQLVTSGPAALLRRSVRLGAAFALAGGIWSVLSICGPGLGVGLAFWLGDAPYLVLLPVPGLLTIVLAIAVLGRDRRAVVEMQ